MLKEIEAFIDSLPSPKSSQYTYSWKCSRYVNFLLSMKEEGHALFRYKFYSYLDALFQFIDKLDEKWEPILTHRLHFDLLDKHSDSLALTSNDLKAKALKLFQRVICLKNANSFLSSNMNFLVDLCLTPSSHHTENNEKLYLLISLIENGGKEVFKTIKYDYSKIGHRIVKAVSSHVSGQPSNPIILEAAARLFKTLIKSLQESSDSTQALVWTQCASVLFERCSESFEALTQLCYSTSYLTPFTLSIFYKEESLFPLCELCLSYASKDVESRLPGQSSLTRSSIHAISCLCIRIPFKREHMDFESLKIFMDFMCRVVETCILHYEVGDVSTRNEAISTIADIIWMLGKAGEDIMESQHSSDQPLAVILCENPVIHSISRLILPLLSLAHSVIFGTTQKPPVKLHIPILRIIGASLPIGYLLKQCDLFPVVEKEGEEGEKGAKDREEPGIGTEIVRMPEQLGSLLHITPFLKHMKSYLVSTKGNVKVKWNAASSLHLITSKLVYILPPDAFVREIHSIIKVACDCIGMTNNIKIRKYCVKILASASPHIVECPDKLMRVSKYLEVVRAEKLPRRKIQERRGMSAEVQKLMADVEMKNDLQNKIEATELQSKIQVIIVKHLLITKRRGMLKFILDLMKGSKK
ncbi:hypothetical protein ADUPG1_013817 [Aduncisulcus paluster]|uniref:Uncharacterized protein n=1 Tax=Aduncisulcus paluster TaxID=2918883 RepID=A0ABQ5K4B4_9EUKA|nr:hypothetical protein ADUPG1_013817 [Aduncisulcus paluster]|eukprot:gnl/Carplike_NY0171/2183_a2940_389.p1 GENE.gnl/Carplike_NY0171/2183_a2940_389~~gnl/Carplike_NY0171/2183_a2940_389.p1  ORF type:complete len:650 (-),score=97.66 gnl/Carplike_NY0171/2183_a2940_389:1071-2993(-)